MRVYNEKLGEVGEGGRNNIHPLHVGPSDVLNAISLLSTPGNYMSTRSSLAYKCMRIGDSSYECVYPFPRVLNEVRRIIAAVRHKNTCRVKGNQRLSDQRLSVVSSIFNLIKERDSYAKLCPNSIDVHATTDRMRQNCYAMCKEIRWSYPFNRPRRP
jgi:hypothetical protein